MLKFTANTEQSKWLHGLYMHLYSVKFGDDKADFGFYAELLDKLSVPFWVQNVVAELASAKENAGAYFHKLCSSRGITIAR